MQIKDILTDDRAVSPVIGVILMVAITVILAAVIGTFVLGLGDQVQSTTPQVQVGFDYNQSADTNGDGNVTITHESGDTLDGAQVSVKETDDTSSATAGTSPSGDLSAGDEIAQGHYDADETIRVVWENPDSDKTSVLGKSDAPSS